MSVGRGCHGAAEAGGRRGLASLLAFLLRRRRRWPAVAQLSRLEGRRRAGWRPHAGCWWRAGWRRRAGWRWRVGRLGIERGRCWDNLGVDRLGRRAGLARWLVQRRARRRLQDRLTRRCALGKRIHTAAKAAVPTARGGDGSWSEPCRMRGPAGRGEGGRRRGKVGGAGAGVATGWGRVARRLTRRNPLLLLVWWGACHLDRASGDGREQHKRARLLEPLACRRPLPVRAGLCQSVGSREHSFSLFRLFHTHNCPVW